MKIQISALAASALAASSALAGLSAYDAKIAADHGAGLPHTAISTTTLNFDTTNSEAFDFGAISGSSTIEFIVSGDPVAGGQNGFLAVGSNGTWSLRYEQWNDTGQLGFTHGGVLDYVFNLPPLPPRPPATPLSASPTDLTHVTYRWDQPTTTMELYLNGDLAGFNDYATGFQFPSGAGFLGNNAGLSQGMLGTIERVTIYNEAVEPDTILAHAEAWNGPGGSLANYDLAIGIDHAGALPHTAISGGTLNFDTTNSEPFDFGPITDSATGEFIVSGDPVAGGQNGFLAVGANSGWSLRFEQWNDTGLLGFTHNGVADNLFFATDAPRLPEFPSTTSPEEPTHVVYRWDQATTTMELYIDGVLAGVNTAATGFQMPTGAGLLGNNPGGSEGLLGVIERVTVYNDAISPDAILAHAEAWLGERALALAVTSDGTNLTFTWPSQSGRVYDLLSETDPETKPDPATWDVFMGNQGLAATPDENTLMLPLPPLVAADPQRFFVIQERPAPPLLIEDFESGQGAWLLGQSDAFGNTEWDIGAPTGISGPASGAGGSANCLGTNLAGDYGPNSDIFARSPVIDLTSVGPAGASVTFMQFRDTDGFGDTGFLRFLDASSNPIPGAAAIPVDFSVFDTNWVEFTAEFPPEAAGKMVRLEFQFTSDNNGQEFSGWFVDDVKVSIN